MGTTTRVLGIAMALAVTVTAAACGSSSDSSSDDGATAAASAAATASEASTAAAASSAEAATSEAAAATSEAAAASSAAAPAAPDLTGQKLTFVNYGGITAETAQKAWLDPFAQATGVETSKDAPSDPAKVKAQVESGNVTWDVIDLDGGSGGAGCGTLFATRAELGVDVSQVDPKFVTDDCGVPIIQTFQVFMYNKDKYGDNPPTKVTDFLDTETFPGKRALFNYSIGALEPLAMAAGVPGDQIYPFDYEKIQGAVDKLGGDLVLQNELAQQAEQLAAGNFDMCMCYTGRAAITPGVDPNKIGIVWDGPWVAYDVLYAVKGSKYPEAQGAFLNFIATPEAQNAFTVIQPYEPTTIGPPPDVPESFKFWMASTNQDKITNPGIVDYTYLAQPGIADEAQAKWTEMTAG